MARKSFFQSLQRFSLAAITALAVFTGSILSYNIYRGYLSKVAQINDNILRIQQARLQSNVQSIKSLAENRLLNIEKEIRQEIFYRTQEALDIAYQIYSSNIIDKHPRTVQALIKDALRAIRYQQGDGYYIIVDINNQTLVMDPMQPELEGQKISSLGPAWIARSTKFEKLIQTFGDGFLRYRWKKTNDTQPAREKISFVKLFAPYNWYVGTGLYLDDFADVIREQIISDVQTFYDNDEGYLLLDESRGLLVGRTKTTADIKQKLEPGSFQQFGDTLYYCQRIGPLNWLIGASTDLNIINRQVAAEGLQARETALTQLGMIIGATGMLILLLQLLVRKQNERLKANFEIFSQSFQKAAKTNRTIVTEQIQYSELADFAATANEMIDENRIIKDGLKSSREFLSLILNSVPEMILTLSGSGNITSANDPAERFAANFRQQYRNPLKALLKAVEIDAQQTSKTLAANEALSLQGKSVIFGGQEMVFDLQLTPISSRQELVVQLSNITKQNRIENMMVQTEKMLSLGGMAAGVAHEINNPLTIISQATQNMSRRLSQELPANRQVAEENGLDLQKMGNYLEQRKILDFIDNIQQATKRAADIVKKLLTFSTYSQNTVQQPCDIEEIINETLKLLQSDYELGKKYDFAKININLAVEKNLPTLTINKVEIEQVLFNLIKNAAQAIISSENNNTAPSISVSATKSKHWLTLRVADNGPGIPPEMLNRIFDPFFTTKEPGIGVGLGLSVAYFIITKHHQGLLTVESEPGKGTTFIIKLPLDPGINGPGG